MGRTAARADHAGADRSTASLVRSRRPFSLALFVVAVAGILPGGVHAEKKQPSLAVHAVDVKAIVQAIRSGDAALIVEGLGAARGAGAGAAKAAPAIEDLLRQGATVPITKAAIEALGAIGQGSSSAAIRPYSRHRTPELRRQAIKALLSTKGTEAISAFKEGLRCSDAVVRGDSASGLGHLGAKEALPDLFAALDRDVTDAAAAIGQLCDPADCERFVGRLGEMSFGTMTSGLDPILFRTQALPDELVLYIVRRLRALETAEAERYLASVQARWPASGSAAVKQALDAATPATSATLGTRP